MILYHAISSYQILSVMLHRKLYHPNKKAVLILPDFITCKYADYLRMIELGFFDEVYLFPYSSIKHDNETLEKEVSKYFRAVMPYELEQFEKIYVAGAHFYLTLYLIHNNIEFDMFEDAPKMLHKDNQLYENLKTMYPVNAEWAKDNGLFDGNNPLISTIYCNRSGVLDKEYVEYSLEGWLACLDPKTIKKLLEFYYLEKIRTTKKSVVFLTQQFAGLGIMTVEQQKEVVEKVVNSIAETRKVIVKRHPDDNVEYDFKRNVKEIKVSFPVELLAFILKPLPETIVTISSTAVENLKETFQNVFSYADEYSDCYSFEDEYSSMMNILNNKLQGE